MRIIAIANSKGGSGKSTIAVNLASYFACWGIRVSLVDFDRQSSAMDWLRVRPRERPQIHGVVASGGTFEMPTTSDYAILDLPAGIHGDDLADVLQLADSVIIPVLPSALDIRAAGRFVTDILQNSGYSPNDTRLCVLANRTRTQTRSYQVLETFLAKLDIPFIAKLRDTQNYVRAASEGRGIFEMPPRDVIKDLAEWQPLVAWISCDERISPIPPIASLDSTR